MTKENLKHQHEEAAHEVMISGQLLDAYIELMQSRFGIMVTRHYKELIKSIQQTCHKYALSPEALLETLKSVSDDSEMLGSLISSITIGETYFFRDKRQIRILKDEIFPAMVYHKTAVGDKSIRIWSAGCSSGEEIYTLVMLLKHIIPDFNDWNCYFLATDINVDLMKKGIAGKYSEWSMRSIPQEYLSMYFQKHDRTYQLSSDICRLVTFDYMNLNSENYPSIMNGTTQHDLILCRNVLIYFDADHVRNILQRLSQCLSEEGMLLLGASDPIAMMDTNLSPSTVSTSLFVKKPEQQVKQPLKVFDKEITPVRISQPDSANKVVNAPARERTAEAKKAVDELVSQYRWSDVITAVDQLELTLKKTPFLLNAKAKALANLGKTQSAIRICEECLEMDKMNKEAWFLYALVLSENKSWKASEAAFRKALYIDPNYLICRYQLGLLLIRLHKTSEGIKALRNVISTAMQCPQDDMVPDVPRMHYRDLVAMLTNEIELHQ